MPGVVSLPRVARCVGFAAALILAVAAGTPSSAQEAGDGLIPEGDWTEEQVAELVALIHETEQALPAHFPALATSAELADTLGAIGYFNFGATAPGGYAHWINPLWVVDSTVIDPAHPESLVYQQTSDGQWRLVSAMFMLNPSIHMDDIPADIAWLPGWHGHPELCINQDGTFGGITDPDNPSCPPGTSPGTTPLMMHVWIEDNACGHRFGGVGIQGLHCEHEDHGDDHGDDTGDDHGDDHGDDTGNGGDDHGDDHGDDMGDGGDHGDHMTPPVAPPAQPVAGLPSFTG